MGVGRPADVGQVLTRLDAIVDRAHGERSPSGYFAAMYRLVTAEVDAEIRAGRFDDPPRMEQLDVVFAQRYLDAVDGHASGGTVTRSWQVAFDAAFSSRLLVLQHLLVGVNAHINLDLGIAAATVAPGAQLQGLRRDFDRINAILFATMGEVQRALRGISPWLGVVDRVAARRHQDVLVRFSLGTARAEAWRLATELAPLAPDRLDTAIAARDAEVARLADLALRPRHLAPLVWLAGLRESRDVRRNLEVLRGTSGPSVSDVDRVLADGP
jgi:hypothetical protein